MAVKLNIAAKPLKKLLPFVKKNQKLMTRIISVKLKRDMPKTEPFKDNAIYIIIESRFQKKKNMIYSCITFTIKYLQ